MKKENLYALSVGKVYPYYVAKVERKGRTKKELDEIFHWLTGYTPKKLESELKKGTSFETFFKKAPKMNPKRKLITGVICGVRVENIEDPIIREMRYLDKLIDELAHGKPMEKILRGSELRRNKESCLLLLLL